MKYDWFITITQVGRNRTRPIFEKLYDTNICALCLYD